MATIGTIEINAIVDTSGIEKGTAKARSLLGDLSTGATQTGAALAALGARAAGPVASALKSGFASAAGAAIEAERAITSLGTAAAAAAAGGVAVMVKSGMDSINTTRQMAERLGESTEAFSKLSYAAKLADVDQESLSGALQKLNQNLGEAAATGEGKTADALTRLGLGARQLAEGGIVNAFHAIAGAIENIPSPAERARTAVELFGKSGQGMLNLIAQGSKGIADLEAEASALGAAFNDVDAARIDEADDAMTRVWAAVGGVAQSLAIELAPWITEASSRITEWAKSGLEGGNAVSQAVDWVASSFGRVLDAIQAAETGFYGLRATWLEGLAAMVKGVESVASKLANIVPGLSKIGKGLGAVVGGDASEFAKLWGEGLKGMAAEDRAAFEKLKNAPWRHEAVDRTVQALKDDATRRALDAAAQGKDWKLGAPVEVDADKDAKSQVKAPKAIHFAKAAELGSSEAANTILTSRYGSGRPDDAKASEAKATAINTKRTADVATQQLEWLQRIGAALGSSAVEAWDMVGKA